MRDDKGFAIAEYDHITGKTVREPLRWLARVAARTLQFRHGNREVQLQHRWEDFKPIGPDFVTVFQLTTFQGVRFALFNYNTGGAPGGQADFNCFTVMSRGRAG